MQNLTVSADVFQTVPSTHPVANDPAKIRDAAQQFEALLLAELLHTANPDGGWLGSGEGGAGSTAVGFAEQALAGSIARHGGIGLSNLIAEGLKRG